MLTIEQVRSLDEKVRMAVDLIDSLKTENSILKTRLDGYKKKVDQLEDVVDSFKLDQLEIEEGIKDVLTQLDKLEDQITTPTPFVQSPPVSTGQQETGKTVFTEETSTPDMIEEIIEEAVSEVIETEQETVKPETEEETEPVTVERTTPELEIF